MVVTLLRGYPDYVGKRFIACFNVKGPKPYVNTATFKTSGDPLPAGAFGFNRYADSIAPAVSLSGTYIVYPVPSLGVGARQLWNLHWFTLSNATEVSNGTDLSAESVQLQAYGGDY